MSFIKKFAKKTISSLTSGLSQDEPTFEDGEDNVFIHGNLIIDIISARELPDMESWIAKLVDRKDVSDPLVDVKLGTAKLAKTSVISNDLNPVWNETFRVEVCHEGKYLLFEVRDKDHAYTEFIGAVNLTLRELMSQGLTEGDFPILCNGKTNGQLRLRVQFIPISSMDRSYVVDSYFGMKASCKVKLYQDAHCLHIDQMPHFKKMKRSDFEEKPLHQPDSCWKDLYFDLINATKVICVTGWAVWDKLQLFRGANSSIDTRTLGEILRDKAEEGVEVSIIVWSEKTSGDLKMQGFMGTHDMETFKYFQGTKVHCALAPRELEKSELTDYLQNEFSTGTYTHHQKSVIVDAPNMNFGDTGRKLVAYVGGLDLTGGRWDTPNHELFSTLLKEHLEDFRNSNAKSVPPEQGPRQPWHDIHMRVEGPIAYDVFLNFYERWLKQGFRNVRLDQIGSPSSDIDINCLYSEDINATQSTSWNCQLFRSITSDSALFDTNRLQTLNKKKGRLVESSITNAYIQMIRNAEDFIYIENQYFMGSSYCWEDNQSVSCHHVIPSEIAQKIVEKIYKGEKFCAYVVIPMFPEGDPTSPPIQEILYWQTKSMEMMYRKIGKALIDTGAMKTGAHPTDYLLFLCPGKKEASGPHLEDLAEPTEEFAIRFRESLRSPIYVHSKMMIVDDSYVIVGSANINQRSMAGTRDTEMAIGAWQPNFTIEAGNPYGDIHNFRMSLWTEHFREWEPVFRFPSDIECIRRIKEMALHNWMVYKDGPSGSCTPGQLLCYPLNIQLDGTVETIEGCTSFPDFPESAEIMGKIHPMIPKKLTT